MKKLLLQLAFVFGIGYGGAMLVSAQVVTGGTSGATVGTAGSPSTQVLSIQGVTSGTVVPVSGSITCSNCSGSGASAVDDAAFAIATGSVAPAGYLANQSSPDSVNEGDVGLARMLLNRIQLHAIWDAAGNERGANVNASNQLLVLDGNSASALTSLQLIDNIPNTLGSTTSGQSGVLGLCATTTSAPTNTTAQSNALSCDTGGALRVVGSSGTTQYAEDAAHSSGDQTVFVSAIRRDTTPSSSSGTAGDYSALNVDANGRLYGNSSLYTPAGDTAMDDTLDAVKITNSTASTATSYLTTRLSDGTNFLTPDTQATHDTALGTITSVTGGLNFGRASAAAPTDVSADGDAVLSWYLRSGAQVVQPSYGGTLAATAASGVPKVGITGNAGAAIDAATGAAPPANVLYIGGVTSGATGGLMTGVPVCDSQAFLNMTTATTTEIVPLTSGRTVHICHIRANSNGTTTMTFKRGTGTNCGTGTAAIDADYQLTAQVGFSAGSGIGDVLNGSSSGNAVCVTNSAAINLQVFVRYAVY